MKRFFVDRITEKDIRPGDCLIEIAPDGSDSFAMSDHGVVLLGHHLVNAQGSHYPSHQFTAAAWQAWLLVLAHPGWRPERIVRSTIVNLDDTLASILVDPETRGTILGSRTFERLLVEVATVDVLGPQGYRALENRSSGVSIVNAINNRAPRPLFDPTIDRHLFARQRAEVMAAAILDIERLAPEHARPPEGDLKVLFENRLNVLAEAAGSAGMDDLYQRGYLRAILVGPADEEGRRPCIVGQRGRFEVNAAGMLRPLPIIDWERANAREPGWGGRDTIGGCPREGTRLPIRELWAAFRIEDEDK